MERLVSLIRADIAGKIYDGTGVIITRGEEVFLHSALGFLIANQATSCKIRCLLTIFSQQNPGFLPRYEKKKGQCFERRLTKRLNRVI